MGPKAILRILLGKKATQKIEPEKTSPTAAGDDSQLSSESLVSALWSSDTASIPPEDIEEFSENEGDDSESQENAASYSYKRSTSS